MSKLPISVIIFTVVLSFVKNSTVRRKIMKNSSGGNFFGGDVIIVNGKVISGDETCERREFDERKSQDSGCVEKIVIDSAVADVNVVSAKASAIDVHFSGKAYVDGNVRFFVKLVGNEFKIAVEVEGNCYMSDFKLNVIVPQKSFKAISIAGCFRDVCIDNEHVVTQKLEVKNSSGKIDIRRGECVKQISLQTSSGNVYVDHVHGNERMAIKTSSGRIAVGKFVWSRFIDLETTTGNIDMIGLAAEIIEVKTSSGKIEANESFFTNKLKVQTTTGNIGITDGDVSEELEVKTTSGKLKANLTCANSLVNTTNGNVEMHFNADRDIKVKVSTSTGKVITSFANIKRMNLSTKSKCGKIKNWHINSFWGYRANVDISTVTGNIEIK